MEVITESESDDRMPPPPRAPLSAAQVSMLQTWINEGALNSNCPDATCDTTGTISFSEQVFPILQNNCISCHNSTLANGGVLLNNYTNVKTAAETERSGTSLLIGAIRRLNNFSAMPPSNTLDECAIRTIERWVEQGIMNN